MSKRMFVLNVLFVIGVLLAALSTTATAPTTSWKQGNAAPALQATDQPPVVVTVQIFPTSAPSGGGGSPIPLDLPYLLVYVLIGAIILIALIAVLRRG